MAPEAVISNPDKAEEGVELRGTRSRSENMKSENEDHLYLDYFGLAVVLRYIVQKTYEADPSKKGVVELLGFKRTCLKACAEISEWTRLCEISIPLAVENFLKVSPNQRQNIPKEILQFENKLGEPFCCHVFIIFWLPGRNTKITYYSCL
ncbi:glutathione S-transferase C-terminal domain-containing protein [Crotalus adamanteus]|uniref:Glutathione S-transferase C-terminal domain-containing protein n=1 Tax=Crotalus adamanteus TaxID=8729 RepID=A0AAW1B9M9_CROAD